MPYFDKNQPWVYMCSPSWTPLPPPSLFHPSGSSQCTSPEHPIPRIEPGLAISFTYDNIHVSVPFSQIIPPSSSPTESKRLFYTSVSLLLSCILGSRYRLSKFHMYALIYCIAVFLSDFTLYNRLQSHPPHQNWFKCILFNSWVILHCVYVPQLSYPFISQWTSRLLPCPGCYNQCCDEHWGTWVSLNSGFLCMYAQQWDCWVVWQFSFQFFKESSHCSP